MKQTETVVVMMTESKGVGDTGGAQDMMKIKALEKGHEEGMLTETVMRERERGGGAVMVKERKMKIVKEALEETENKTVSETVTEPTQSRSVCEIVHHSVLFFCSRNQSLTSFLHPAIHDFVGFAFTQMRIPWHF